MGNPQTLRPRKQQRVTKRKNMYIIDYKKQAVKQFKKSELAFFLNSSYDKKRYLFVNTKKDAKKLIRHITSN